jgi:CheY-like chemotaxis protein
VERTFRQIAADKGLEFAVELDPALPAAIRTDGKRLQQILKNLLSNAFKFTGSGKVTLRIFPARSGWSPRHKRLSSAKNVIAFSVTDTGVGIPPAKQDIIFEAFQQADGTTSRQYGGTGLGLSISRELATLLGGEIRVSSTYGQGSNFTLFLPVEIGEAGDQAPGEPPLFAPSQPAPQAAAAIRRGMLIAEQDASVAAMLMEAARKSGFHTVVAPDAASALAQVKRLRPDAVLLDLALPDMEGTAVLDLLKRGEDTRHIPVVVLAPDEQAIRYRAHGAYVAVQKPVVAETLALALARTRVLIERSTRTLLVADGDERQRREVVGAFQGAGLEVTQLGSGAEALEVLRRERFDCMLVGARLRDMTAPELLTRVVDSALQRDTPVVLYGAEGFSRGERDDLKRLADSAVLRTVRSMEALLDEAAMHLQKPIAGLQHKKKRLAERLQHLSAQLHGKTVLVVDDDPRNIFALSSALEQQGMRVLHATDGRSAMELLTGAHGVDAVLMDVMMPGMDGYDTVRRIRQMDSLRDLPVIAITARAMKGDREKCLESGASDYIAKPVSVDELLSLLRVWLLN